MKREDLWSGEVSLFLMSYEMEFPTCLTLLLNRFLSTTSSDYQVNSWVRGEAYDQTLGEELWQYLFTAWSTEAGFQRSRRNLTDVRNFRAFEQIPHLALVLLGCGLSSLFHFLLTNLGAV